MSYNGTVRCRECYNTGHNRRTCPQLTERLQRRAQNELDQNGTKEGFYGRQYAKRTGTNIDGSSVFFATKKSSEPKVGAK